MAYQFYTKLSNAKNYGSTRSASSIKYLVYHYTANKTDKASSNANYFANNVVKASAHYFVDDTSVYQSVPDLTIAYSVGGSKYANCSITGGGKMYGVITNSNSISIEMCSNDGCISEATLKNAIELGKSLMKKYNIPITNVYRHFDVTGKSCPGWSGWIDSNPIHWNELKKGLEATPTPSTSNLYRVRKSWTDVKSQIGAYSNLDNAKRECKVGYSVFDSNGNIVYSNEEIPTPTPTPQPTPVQTNPTPAPTQSNVLKQGDRGDAVKTMQNMLNTCGYDCGKADGIFGSGTKNALVKMQKANGLVGDGIYGAKSKAKLEELYKVKITPKPVTPKPTTTPIVNTNTYSKKQFIKDVQSAIGAKVD